MADENARDATFSKAARPLRGRRSSIIVPSMDKELSPTVVPTPLNDSNISDKGKHLLQQKVDILNYITKLKTETEEWDNTLETYDEAVRKMEATRCEIIDRPRGSKRLSMSEMALAAASNDKPKFIFNKVIQMFKDRSATFEVERDIQEIDRKLERDEEKLSKKKQRLNCLKTLIEAESVDDLKRESERCEEILKRDQQRRKQLSESLNRINELRSLLF